MGGVLAGTLFFCLSLTGCGRRERRAPASGQANRATDAGSQRERAQELAKRAGEAAPEVQITKGGFTARDAAGRVVLEANARSWHAAVSAEHGVQGPVTLEQVSCKLYREGRPSLWLKTPRGVWEDGVLRAVGGIEGGAVDGRIACVGASGEWVARTNLLTVRQARCECAGAPPARDAGHPALHVEGPVAQWLDGLLTMPAGVDARSADGQGTLRARHLTWTAANARLVATGNVVATRGGTRMTGETLTADTRLRRFQMRGAAPRAMQQLASRGKQAPIRAAANAAPATGTTRRRVTFDLPNGWKGEADTFTTNFGAQPVEFEASGRVTLTGPTGSMSAPRVTGLHDQKRGLLVARASGGVRMETTPENGRSIVARGQEAVYEPPQDRVSLTGGAEAVMTSPQLAEPARLVGDRAVVQLRRRTAAVYRTPAARVQLTLRPKREPQPIELSADQVSYDDAADRVTATGRPVMKNPRGTLTADRIVFDLAPTATAPGGGGRPADTTPGGTAGPLLMARATGNVVVDARWEEPNAQTIHATGGEATYVRAQDEITLRGDVQGTVTTPNSPKPASISGDRMVLNLQTRRLTVTGAPAQVQTIPPARRSGNRAPTRVPLQERRRPGADRGDAFHGRRRPYRASGACRRSPRDPGGPPLGGGRSTSQGFAHGHGRAGCASQAKTNSHAY